MVEILLRLIAAGYLTRISRFQQQEGQAVAHHIFIVPPPAGSNPRKLWTGCG